MHLAVGLLDLSELLAALVLRHGIEDVRHGPRAADPAQGRGGHGIRLLLDQLVQFRQRGLRHLVERRDAHQHFGAHLLGQQRHDVRRLLRIEVGENDGGDLRMFAADDLGDCLGLHPLERLDALAGLPRGDAVQQRFGLLLAHRLSQHAPDVILRPGCDVRLAVGDADEFLEHRGHLVARHLLELGHGHAQPLHVLGVELLEQVGGVLLAQAHQENGRALCPVEFVPLASHRRRPIPSPPGRRASGPARPRSARPPPAARSSAAA